MYQSQQPQLCLWPKRLKGSILNQTGPEMISEVFWLHSLNSIAVVAESEQGESEKWIAHLVEDDMVALDQFQSYESLVSL
ncbi:hypothetical protein FGO68_gene5755 [Halteria grandinella]|uniref:Uncharacterized protein n=1 Tax=Halteria grandinella TaxID=5974 RepID=A0A8J8SVJ8_HALGN|nr:hypothetical protein FGO68_gene5755 [Halteria grandinella]